MNNDWNACGFIGYCGIRAPHESHMRVDDLRDEEEE